MQRFERAVEANPRAYSAWFNLGSIHFNNRDWQRAAECFRKATDLNARFEEAWGALGWALENSGDDQGAVDCFRRALELDPGLLVVPVRLADLLATSQAVGVRNAGEALRLSESLARRTRGRNRHVLDTLAAAYAANGRYSEAVKAARRALQLPGDADSDSRLRSRLEAYEAGRPAVRTVQGTKA
jgi:tetratricopeptide (TPR) repeat protein